MKASNCFRSIWQIQIFVLLVLFFFHFFKYLNSLQNFDLQERGISVYEMYPSIKLVLLSHINENVLMDGKETCGTWRMLSGQVWKTSLSPFSRICKRAAYLYIQIENSSLVTKRQSRHTPWSKIQYRFSVSRTRPAYHYVKKKEEEKSL